MEKKKTTNQQNLKRHGRIFIIVGTNVVCLTFCGFVQKKKMPI